MENTRTERWDLRELWSAARETLAAAQEQAAAAKECTARGALPDGAMVRSLVEALQRYAAQYQALQEAGVPLRGNAQEVEEFLDACEKRRLEARVQAYFGLNAKDAQVQEALEASKHTLARLCGAPQTASASALNPFALAADSVRNGLRPLSEADFEAIEAAMGKSIARAVDNGSLLWQENAVVALGREEPREAPIPAIEPIQEHAPWDALEGYVDDASASFAGQVEAAPSRQELQRLLREEKAAAQLLCRLAHEKMLPCPRQEETSLWLAWECLRAAGYAMLANLNGIVAGQYCLLTGKGWACWRDDELRGELVGEAYYNDLPAFMRPDSAQCTALLAVRTAMICAYCAARGLEYELAWPGHAEFPYAVLHLEGYAVCAGVFARGDETRDLACLRACAAADGARLIVLVATVADIARVHAALQLPAEEDERLWFAVWSENGMYAGNGETVDVPDAFWAVSVAPQVLSPRTPLKASLKCPSKQEFLAFIVRQWAAEFAYLANLFSVEHVLTEEQLREAVNGESERGEAALAALEAKGYICAYMYNEKLYYCAGPLMRECIKKPQLMEMFRRLYPRFPGPYAPTLIGETNLPAETLGKYIALNALYHAFVEKLKTIPSIGIERQQVRWFEKEGHYCLSLHSDGKPLRLMIVAEEDFLSVQPTEAGVICAAQLCPEMTRDVAANQYYCLADAFYCWDGNAWVDFAGNAE